MDVLGSEYSSGCESGWTVYLEQSLLSPNRDVTGQGNSFSEFSYKGKQSEDEEEEDSSMVSDASSGPPHFHEDQGHFNDGNGRIYPASDAASSGKKCGKRQRIKEPRRRKDQELHSFLDDTASSTVFDKNNHITNYNHASMESAIDFSHGFSSNFEGRSAFQDHYGFLQPSESGNQLPFNQLSYNVLAHDITLEMVGREEIR